MEYRTRLARAEGEVHRLWTEHRLAQEELKPLAEALPALESAAREADRAYEARDVTGPVHLGVVDAYLRSAYEAEDRTQGLLEARVALQTVLGPPGGLRPRVSERSRNGRTGTAAPGSR